MGVDGQTKIPGRFVNHSTQGTIHLFNQHKVGYYCMMALLSDRNIFVVFQKAGSEPGYLERFY